VLFAVALMTKPMVITLPALLLLLDYWPLGRINHKDLRRMIVEKIPLAALSLASALVTFFVQRHGGAVAPLDRVPLGLRIANACIAYVQYLAKTIRPAGLAIFYPLPKTYRTAEVIAAVMVLMAITVLALHLRRRLPPVTVGWLWYLLMLTPVIGIIQVGEQSMADRYTYLPLVGFFIMIVWTIAAIIRDAPIPVKSIAGAAAIFFIGISALLTRQQLYYWQNSETLFRHATLVTRDNWLAYNHLSTSLADQQRFPEALEAAHKAVALHPAAVTYFNYANVLRQSGALADAQMAYHQALGFNPRLLVAKNNLAITLAQLGDPAQAETLLREIIAQDPEYADAYANLGTVLVQEGRPEDAIRAYHDALQKNPNHPIARRGLERLHSS